MLVFYRIIQGIGGGALQPTAQAILFETYPPQKRGAAMAIFGMGAMVGPAIGPMLGGYIVDNANWPLIFYINIPIGIVAFLMTLAFIPNPKFIASRKAASTGSGLALLTAGLASLQYVLERGERDDWFALADDRTAHVRIGVALIVFVVKSLRDRYPIVDLRVFKFRSFSVGSFLGVIMGFGLFGTALVLPLFFQTDPRLHGVRHRHGAAARCALDRRVDAHHRTHLQPHRRAMVDRLRHAALCVVDVAARAD